MPSNLKECTLRSDQALEERGGTARSAISPVTAFAGLGALSLAACALVDQESSQRAELVELLGREPTREDGAYSPSVIFWNTDGRRNAERLAFYWSPTCAFSANKYVNTVFRLLSDSEATKKFDIGLFQVSRNELDVDFFARMMAYNDYPLLASSVMRVNARRGFLMPVDDIDRLAAHMKMGRRTNFNEEAARQVAMLSTNTMIEQLGINRTPVLFLNEREIDLV